MNTESDFTPRWSSAPGATISAALKERRMSIAEFAALIGEQEGRVRELLDGRIPVSVALARALADVIGGSAEFWLTRDFQYRGDVERLRREEERAWLKELPVGDMVRFGWLKPTPRPAEEAQACLNFFAVPSVEAWRARYAGVMHAAAFRNSRSFDSRPGAVAAWLRQGELQAQALDCAEWRPGGFLEVLKLARGLTRQKDPARFLPRLVRSCSDVGVAVVVVRAPAGCRASGATFFRQPGKAVLMLSFRHLSDDHFWFTFFHEAGHLLLHGADRVFVENIESTRLRATEESEADAFAAEWLIPSQLRNEMLMLPPRVEEVIRFAVRAGVAPGIVVGQLQHAGRLGMNKLNDLKRRYTWPDSLTPETL